MLQQLSAHLFRSVTWCWCVLLTQQHQQLPELLVQPPAGWYQRLYQCFLLPPCLFRWTGGGGHWFPCMAPLQLPAPTGDGSNVEDRFHIIQCVTITETLTFYIYPCHSRRCLAVYRHPLPGLWFFSEFQWEPAVVLIAFNMNDTVEGVRQHYHDTITLFHQKQSKQSAHTLRVFPAWLGCSTECHDRIRALLFAGLLVSVVQWWALGLTSCFK